jgi:phage terminase Nu1 subunit (DNA packaging protein)
MKPTQSKIAAALDVSKQMVSKWVRQGMPVYSVDAAAAWRQQHIGPSRRSALSVRRPASPTAAAASPDPRIAKARLDRDEAQATIARLQADELQGKLMRTDVHDRAMRLVASATVQLFASIPDRVAVQFGATHAERMAIRKCLVDELRALRETLSHSGAEVYAEIDKLVSANGKVPPK